MATETDYKLMGAWAVIKDPDLNIDRRGAKRTVPMEVLCFGLPRTGTLSMQEAMKILGYECPYHFSSIFANLRDADMWQTVLQHKQQVVNQSEPKHDDFDYRAFFDQLLGHTQAISDVPGVSLWRELAAAYPDARIVLVERDINSWVQSMENLLDASLNPIGQYVFRYLDPMFFGRIFSTSARWINLMFGTTDKATCKAGLREVYRQHYAEVRAEIPEERLLNYQLSSGWDPLCEFLEKDNPSVPFPHCNETKAIEASRSITTKMGLMNVLKNLSVVVGVGAVIAGVLSMR